MSKNLLQDEPLWHKIVKKWFWLYFFTYLAAPAWYITRVLISNTVSVDDVGLLYSIIWLFGILSMYNGLWLTESLKYFLPTYLVAKEFDKATSVLTFSIFVQWLTSILIVWCIVLFWDRFALHYFKDPDSIFLLYNFLLFFIAANIIQICTTIAISIQNTFIQTLITTIWRRTTAIFIVWLFFCDYQTLEYYQWWFILGNVVACIYWLISMWKKYYNELFSGTIYWNKKYLSGFLWYSLWTFIAMSSHLLLGHIDQQMVVSFIWQEAAWIFSNYMSLMWLYSILILPIMWLVFPMMSELSAKKDKKQTKDLQHFIYSYFWVFTFALIWLLFWVWPVLASILFWTKFIDSWHLLHWWAISLFFQFISTVNFSLLSWYWKARRRAYLIIFTSLSNVLLNLLLIPVLWLIWVVIATVLNSVILFLWSLREAKKIITLSIDTILRIKNFIFILWWWIILFYYWDDIFIYENAERYNNIIKILIVGVIYWLCLLLINYKQIPYVIRYIKAIRA